MRTSLENKFGKTLKATKFSSPSENYIGDSVEVSLPTNHTREKEILMQDGVPVGYNKRQTRQDGFSTKSVYYDYPIKAELEQEFSKLLLTQNTRINICCYMVSTNGLKPYLRYLLYKYPKSSDDYSDLLVFPFFLYEKTHHDIKEVCRNNVLEYLDNIGGPSSVDVVGYKKTDIGLCVFVELDNKVYDSLNEIKHQTRGSELWLVLMKEILDVKNVINFPIHSSVTNFFLNNMSFIFLLDKDDRPYTLPLVAYHGNYYKVISFVAVFGLKNPRVFSSLGPYYYFGTYEKALRYAVWTQSHTPMTVDGETITVNETGKYKRRNSKVCFVPRKHKSFLKQTR